MPPSHMTLSDLEGQAQGHADFETLHLVKNLVRPYVTIIKH